jgi:hypothetical protein
LGGERGETCRVEPFQAEGVVIGSALFLFLLHKHCIKKKFRVCRWLYSLMSGGPIFCVDVVLKSLMTVVKSVSDGLRDEEEVLIIGTQFSNLSTAVDTSATAAYKAWCVFFLFFLLFFGGLASCGCLRPCFFRHLSFLTSPYAIQTYSRRHLSPYRLLHASTSARPAIIAESQPALKFRVNRPRPRSQPARAGRACVLVVFFFTAVRTVVINVFFKD